MVFALDKDDGGLRVFPSPAAAAGHCKGVDVRDGFWFFFADDGSPLEARFEQAEIPGGPAPAAHAFTLQRAMSGRWLQERIPEVRTVTGCGISSVGDVVETLKVNRGKRISPPKRA